MVKIIVGNKVDKDTFSREVSTKEGEDYARRMGCLFLECSAKANLGVEEAFKELVLRVRLDPLHILGRTDTRGGIDN